MTRHVTVIGPGFPLRAAWHLMQAQHIRHLPVVQLGRLVGILSDRDVLLRAVLEKDGALIVPADPAATAMTPAPITCALHTSVSWLAQTMITRQIDAVPVLDDGDLLVGLVTSTDLLVLLSDYEEGAALPFDFRLVEGKQQAVA